MSPTRSLDDQPDDPPGGAGDFALSLRDSKGVPTMRILIADDHELVRGGLRSILVARAGWEVCAEAADGREAIEKAKELKPDVVLLDIAMPHVNGLDAARIIRRDVPHAKVIILSQYDGSEMRATALDAGAQGYVSKSDASSQLLIAIDALIDNHHRVPITTRALPETSPCRRA